MSCLEWKKSACPYDCPDACGLLMETDGKKVYHIRPDKEHPETCGFICRKMTHYERTIHHPGRILTPLKRTGAKGSGQFEPISWDVALKEISKKWKMIIETYGSEAIMPYSYAGAEHLVSNKCGEAFFNRLGASALERTICSIAKAVGYQQIIGGTRGINPQEMRFSDLIIIWGANVNAISVHLQSQIVKAKKRGVPVILIETYKSPAHRLADKTFLLPPGTDGALALAMAHVLKKAHLTDKTFIRKYTSGSREFFPELRKYTPEWAASVTKLRAEDIISLAELYGKAKAPVIVFGSGMSRHGNGAMTTRCITVLPAMVGAFAKPGGGIWGNINSGMAFDTDIVRRPDFLKHPVRTLNMNQFGSALAGFGLSEDGLTKTPLEPPIKSVYIYNSNPVDIAPAQTQVIRGLMREDLFTVVHERFMTDTAKYADIILPADTSAEHWDIVKPYGHFTVQKIAPAIAPLGEARSNWNTFCALAQAMGFEEDYFKMSEEEICNAVIDAYNEVRSRWTAKEKADFDAGKAVSLRLKHLPDIKTSDGKIHFKDDSLQYPMPKYIENYGGKYPLKLVVGPSLYSLNSTFNERSDLVDERGRLTLKMNTEDANARGIADGNIVEAYNDLARIEIFAEVSEDVLPGTVVAEGVYKLDQSLNELTVNALLSERLTDAGRASTLCDNTIEIAKLE